MDGFASSFEREDIGSGNGAMESDNQRREAERVAGVVFPLLGAGMV